MGVPEYTSASGYDGLDQSSEGWLADCFNDAEMHCSSEEWYVSFHFRCSIQSSSLVLVNWLHEYTAHRNLSGTSDAQIDNSGKQSLMYHPILWVDCFPFPLLFSCFFFQLFVMFILAYNVIVVEFSNTVPEYEATVAQQRPTRPHQNVVFKGLFLFSVLL